MTNLTHCTGLTWIPTILHGQPHRLFARDCPRRRECMRFRLNDQFMRRGDPGARVSYMDGPEHGVECGEFVRDEG